MSVRVVENAGVAVITLARPPVNAMDHDTIVALGAAFKRLKDDARSSGAILTGEGAAFSAGVDVRAFASYDARKRREMALAITQMTAEALALPFPLIAAINGHALGGGFVLALCCDYRIAVDEAGIRLGMPEASAGVPFPAGPLRIIRHELPPSLLRTMPLSSEAQSPRRLWEGHAIDTLVPREALLTKAHDRVVAIAAQPGFAVVKKQVRGALAADVAAFAYAGHDPFLDHFGRPDETAIS